MELCADDRGALPRKIDTVWKNYVSHENANGMATVYACDRAFLFFFFSSRISYAISHYATTFHMAFGVINARYFSFRWMTRVNDAPPARPVNRIRHSRI